MGEKPSPLGEDFSLIVDVASRIQGVQGPRIQGKAWTVFSLGPLNLRILESQASAIFPFKDLVTHRVSLDNINDGLRIADSGKAIRVAILP